MTFWKLPACAYIIEAAWSIRDLSCFRNCDRLFIFICYVLNLMEKFTIKITIACHMVRVRSLVFIDKSKVCINGDCAS